MITYETLEAYKNKCDAALDQVIESIAQTQESLEMLGKQQIAITAQIETLTDLMDIKKTPPVVELPLVAPEDIEEHFDNRLETHNATSDAEVYAARQDNVYLKEAMEAVETLDAANRAKEN